MKRKQLRTQALKGLRSSGYAGDRYWAKRWNKLPAKTRAAGPNISNKLDRYTNDKKWTILDNAKVVKTGAVKKGRFPYRPK